jgi:Xaa-Pro aminopeptidase
MNEYQRRRERFVKDLGDAVAIIPSADEIIRTNDSEFDFRQDSDFFYLTGFDEPSSVLVLAPAHETIKSALFVRPNDKEKETWNGVRAGVEGAKPLVGVDATYPIGELSSRIGEFLQTSGRLYYSFVGPRALNDLVQERARQARRSRPRADGGPLEIIDPSLLLHEQRLIKSSHDIAKMRRAVEISALGHIAAMRNARPGMHEYEVEAFVEYVFLSQGAQSPAYPSIVSSGKNLRILHYRTNRDRIPDGSLVLVDAGAEVDYYCGDITRTWPISGKFSAEQRAVYEIVLAANLRAIELCRSGRTLNTEVNDGAARVLVQGLLELGLLKGSADEHMEHGTHKRFTLHRVGHWLGLDTHDVGSYRTGGDWRPLAPGMILTIEPGLYISDEDDIPERFRNISVRVEDDVLITDGEPDVLSKIAPKTIHAIEQLMAEGRATAQALIA